MAAPSHQASARCLLRGLLRECSYLPDANARHYMKAYALDRFRRHRAFERHRNALGIDVFPEQISAEHKVVQRQRTKHMALARSWVRLLHRAGAQFQVKPLLKVLGMTYGRIGERRHRLLAALDATGGPEPLDLIRRTFAPRNYQEQFLELLPVMSRQVERLLLSQRKMSSDEYFRANPKKVGIFVDETNIFKRPMPRKRVKNATHKQYNALLDRALPPLPADEFRRIEALATGMLAPELPVKRRSQTASGGGSDRSDVNEHSNLLQALQITPAKQQRPAGKDHNFTPRLIARLYQRILRNCPVMSWDPLDKDWSVQWGSLQTVNNTKRARNQALARHLDDVESMEDGMEADRGQTSA